MPNENSSACDSRKEYKYIVFPRARAWKDVFTDLFYFYTCFLKSCLKTQHVSQSLKKKKGKESLMNIVILTSFSSKSVNLLRNSENIRQIFTKS